MFKPLNLNVPDRIRAALSDDDFRVICNAGDPSEPAELLIMEQIGEDVYGGGVIAVEARGFIESNRDRDIRVVINSPGGLVYDGIVIYNGLANHPKKVIVDVVGLAYSAASLIAMAGDKIRMHEASDIGIHFASMIALGNKSLLRDAADWLETIDGHLVDIYTVRTGQDREKVVGWMSGTVDGTLFPAKEAVELGFADEIIPHKRKNNESTDSRDRIEKTFSDQVKKARQRNYSEQRSRLYG